MTLTEYRASLLRYLEDEKAFILEDIERDEQLSDEEKILKGLLLKDCRVIKKNGTTYEMTVSVNNSKLRPGDIISLSSLDTEKHITATIIENGFKTILISTSKALKEDIIYDIHVKQTVMLDVLINLIKRIDEGLPGAALLKILSGSVEPNKEGLGKLRHAEGNLPKNLNEKQHEACIRAFSRPNIYCVQGPPGTGKTDVLATIANAFSKEGKTVLIISNTHQAVNNALLKIKRSSASSYVVKLGNKLKSQSVEDVINIFESFNSYLSERKSRKHKLSEPGDIIGMTLQSAFFNMGIRLSGLNPSIVLVDEAGQMPLVEAAAIGTFGTGSIVFIGDDRQMPPIFHEKLQDDELSTSIFSFIARKFPAFRTTLNVTYRMNKEITQLVSSRFYEPYGIILEASEFSRNRKLSLEVKCDDLRIVNLLSSEESLLQIDVTTDDNCEDMNIEEARFIASLVNHAIQSGMDIRDMAIITPYRRQVRAIINCCSESLEKLPLIDTVERLQGEDVDLIIMSMCVSRREYFDSNKYFLLNPNRLNVMYSRAKKKVIVIAPKIFNSLI